MLLFKIIALELGKMQFLQHLRNWTKPLMDWKLDLRIFEDTQLVIQEIASKKS